VIIPTLDVDAPVIPTGVDPDGYAEIPQDVNLVGWYRFGPVPGAGGSAVLVGHVGDEVVVADGTGTQQQFSVVAREQWDKAETPLDRLFDRSGSPRLVLITCGGSFDPDQLGYRDNIAVTAVPVGG
jgi:sortase (surface protein transpeptidase)